MRAAFVRELYTRIAAATMPSNCVRLLVGPAAQGPRGRARALVEVLEGRATGLGESGSASSWRVASWDLNQMMMST